MGRNYTSDDINEKLEKVKDQEYVSERNAELLDEFIQYLKADSDVSSHRQAKYLTNFKTLFKKFIDFDLDQATKKDLRLMVGKLEDSDYSGWTKSDFKVAIKKFYRTIHEEETERPKRVKKILNSQFMKTGRNVENKREVVALEPEEVMELVDQAETTRNKLLPLFLFETGARVGEILGHSKADTVRLGDIELKQKYAEAEIDTLKNDKGSRVLTLTKCVGLLQKWMEEHPRKDDPEAFLFVNYEDSGSGSKGDVMTRSYVSKILRRLAKRAELDKRVNPHAFRHSSATHKGMQWSVSRLMYWHGWKDSKQAETYCHENEQRMKEARLEEEGINPEKNGSDPTKRKECGRCGESWPPTQKYCGKCSLALDKDTAEQERSLEDTGEELAEAQISGINEEDLKQIKEEVLRELDS